MCNEFALPISAAWAWATQLFSKKCCSSGEPLPAKYLIWPAQDLNLRLPAPKTSALPLDQVAGAFCKIIRITDRNSSTLVLILICLLKRVCQIKFFWDHGSACWISRYWIGHCACCTIGSQCYERISFMGEVKDGLLRVSPAEPTVFMGISTQMFKQTQTRE